jgi:hypothetical protein
VRASSKCDGPTANGWTRLHQRNRPAGFFVTFDDEKKLAVVLPWPGKQPPPKLYQDVKATVLVETKEGKTVFTILKMESEHQTIYEGEPKGS